MRSSAPPDVYTSESPGITPSPPNRLPLFNASLMRAVVVSNAAEPGATLSLNGKVSPSRSQNDVLKAGAAGVPLTTKPSRTLSQYVPSDRPQVVEPELDRIRVSDVDEGAEVARIRVVGDANRRAEGIFGAAEGVHRRPLHD